MRLARAQSHGEHMHIALTGATGFLGRYLVRHLASAGHSLRCWYRPTSDRTGFQTVNSLEWLPGSLGDDPANLLQGVEAVVHAAVDWDGPRQRRREREQRGELQAFLEHNLM